MNKKMIDAEIELVKSDLFRQFAQKHTVYPMDDLEYVIYYLRWKDAEKSKQKDKFNLGWFINEVRQKSRA